MNSRENIDSINAVSVLVIRTDGNRTPNPRPTVRKWNTKCENCNVQLKTFPFSDRKILFIVIRRLDQGTTVTP